MLRIEGLPAEALLDGTENAGELFSPFLTE
jgi:hypothetical protein